MVVGSGTATTLGPEIVPLRLVMAKPERALMVPFAVPLPLALKNAPVPPSIVHIPVKGIRSLTGGPAAKALYVPEHVP